MAPLTAKQAQMFHKNIKSSLLAYSFYPQPLRGVYQEALSNIPHSSIHQDVHERWLETGERIDNAKTK